MTRPAPTRVAHGARTATTPPGNWKRFFGFDDFRPVPADDDGHPYQQVIVETAMQGRDVLAILPTGTGKSLCYQIPALSRYDKTGALTVVISPLVALMADQVAGLSEARDHLVRHDQRAPVDARAGRGAGEGAAGRRRHRVDLPGAVAQHAHAPSTAAA